METENAKRNPRQTEGSSLPTITLAVLILTILALLYVGYEYVADDTKGSEELTSVALDTTVQKPVELPLEPELVAPIEIDTSSRNAPVDLSQTVPSPLDEEKEVPKKPALDSEERPAVGKPAEKPVAEVKEEKPVREEKPVEEKPKEEKPKEEKKETPKVNIPAGGVSITHTVKPGETIYSVATKYNLSISTLKALNPDLKDNAVKADVTKLKVKARAYHTVGAGDILRVVAEKYGVTVDALMKANGKTKNYAARGEKLVIPYAEKQ
ncbi:LysM peptidoglycan-binding domain-containing protein [Larkinella humicola]|uniref:LysM peptidoglycan-binding domain-containing protein n=1 Tax=Larkinella humicola TaxID=2607654 RepID=A0A5N1JQ43_9BACT|nr:LysM domain-containing protein [Larkinella humicola]KAA9355257.1 LysM peptidoglycan-binding domain-containing protein [Larkinella humicola]